MAVQQNYIAGEWIGGGAVIATSTRRTRPTSSASTRAPIAAQVERARSMRPPARRFPPGRGRRRRSAPMRSTRSATRSSRARTSSAAAVARGRQDAARGRSARPARAGQIFKFFAGEALRLAGREARLGAPGHRGRDHARAGRRRRHHHAVELPDRHPGLEDRAGARLRQHASSSSPPIWCPARAWALAEIIARAGAAGGRVQPRDGPRLGGRRGARRPPGRRRDQLHRLGRDRQARSPRQCAERMRQGPARDGRQEPAGRARRRRPRRSR